MPVKTFRKLSMTSNFDCFAFSINAPLIVYYFFPFFVWDSFTKCYENEKLKTIVLLVRRLKALKTIKSCHFYDMNLITSFSQIYAVELHFVNIPLRNKSNCQLLRLTKINQIAIAFIFVSLLQLRFVRYN